MVTGVSIEDRIFSVVRNLCEYRLYKGDTGNAAKILHKHLPAFSVADCLGILEFFSERFARIRDLIHADKDSALAAYESCTMDAWLSAKGVLPSAAFKDDFRDETILISIGYFLVEWIFVR